MIWLPNEEEKTIYQAVAVPTDKDGINSLWEKYSDPARFLLYDTDKYSYKYDEGKEYNFIACKALVNLGDVITPEYRFFYDNSRGSEYHSDSKQYYINPISYAYYAYLQSKGISASYNLLELFESLQYYDVSREINEFERAKKIITQYEQVSLDKETFEASVQQMWPAFGYFATEFLGRIDIVPKKDGEFYTLEQIDRIKGNISRIEGMKEDKAFLEECGISIKYSKEKEWQNILDIQTRAENNAKVLSLAKRVQKRCNSK